MNEVEDRVRAALRVHAEDFTAAPDAWQQLRAKRPASLRGQTAWRRSWPVRFIVPAGAAAAVAAVVLAGAAVSGSFGRTGTSGASGTSPTGSAGAGRSSATASPASGGSLSPSGPAGYLLMTDPPTGTISRLEIPWTAPGRNGGQSTGYFWTSEGKPSYWLDQVLAGPQFCNYLHNATTGQSGGFCWPLSQPGPSHPVLVTGDANYITNQRILVGVAADQVTSVIATLPDGQRFAGAVTAGRGFSGKTWVVGYPPSAGVRLVFKNAAGQQVTALAAAGPDGPPRLAQPRAGGVTVFTYSAAYSGTGGTMTGYLVQGRVGFWSPLTGGLISPKPASGAPALGGIFVFFSGRAFGYAHGNVTRVVVRYPGGQASAATFAAGWPGSDIRLWSVSLPRTISHPIPPMTLTGYDAAGHVVSRLDLGTSDFG